MQIQQNSSPLIVFLLVKQSDGLSAATGQRPSVQYSANGASFKNTVNAPAEIGQGWYKIQLSSAETKSAGPLVLRATGSGTLEWRDIHQVVTADGTTPDNPGTEGPGTEGPGTEGPGTEGPGTEGPGTEGPGTGVTPGTGTNLIRNGDFSQGSSDWVFYTNGVGDWEVANKVSTVSVAKLGDNIQLYQRNIAVTPGLYNVKLEIKGPASRRVQVLLHQHDLPRTNLGLNDGIVLNNGWTKYERVVQLSPAEDNARFRIWFAGTAQPGDVYQIRNVSLIRQS